MRHVIRFPLYLEIGEICDLACLLVNTRAVETTRGEPLARIVSGSRVAYPRQLLSECTSASLTHGIPEYLGSQFLRRTPGLLQSKIPRPPTPHGCQVEQ